MTLNLFFVLFCFFDSSQSVKCLFLLLWDVMCPLTWNGDKAKYQYCFQNLYKDMLQNLISKTGISYAKSCVFISSKFVIIASFVTFFFFLQHSSSWIKLSVLILSALYWWNSFFLLEPLFSPSNTFYSFCL